MVPAGAANRKVCIIDSGYYQLHEDLKDSGVTGQYLRQRIRHLGQGLLRPRLARGGHHLCDRRQRHGCRRRLSGGQPPHREGVRRRPRRAAAACAWTYSSTLVDALNNCAAAGANVVSMSLGGRFKSAAPRTSRSRNAYSSGVLSVAAAGNGGNRPHVVPCRLRVRHLGGGGGRERGQGATSRSTNRDVEIAAPGVGVLSTVPWLENNTLTSGDDTVSGGHIEGAARTDGYTGAIVDGGQVHHGRTVVGRRRSCSASAATSASPTRSTT